MAKKFHIVPDTGEARPCSAEKQGCKYGDNAIHGDSVEEVQKQYEESMKNQTFSNNSEKNEEEYDNDSFYDRTEFTIPEENYETAVNKINAANRRLEKNGINERFEMEANKIFVPKKKKDPEDPSRMIEYAEAFYEIKINEPKLSYDGYEFLAVMKSEGKGFLVNSRKDVELGGERPDAMYCEHCGHNRHRAKTYLIKTPEGDTKQIGSRCVEAYLGVRPEGLWALEYSAEDAIESGSKRRGDAAGVPHYPVNTTLAIALAASNHGKDFHGASSYGGVPTTVAVDDIRHGGKLVDPTWRSEMLAKVDEIESTNAVKELKDKINAMEGNSDYVKNLQVAISDDYGSVKNQNLLVSAVSILAREERQRKIEEEKERKRKLREETFKPGHVGQPGDKMKNMSYEVMEVKEFTTSDPYSYYGGDITKYVTTMRDEEGRKLTYFASEDIREFKDDEGKVFFTSGRIKEHKVYDEQDQTVLSHMRVKKPKRVPDGTDGYGNKLLPGD